MLVRIVVGIFMVLHGLVHLLYFGQARRFFEMQEGLQWPDSSWAFSRLLGQDATRWLAAIACVLAALGFVAGGLAIFAGWTWWRPVVIGSAAFSTAIWILFWNGMLQRLSEQGLIAILINAAILVALLVFGWPDFGF
jgi:hypothetical protein